MAPVDRIFNQKLASDAMFKAEHEKKDKEKSDEAEGQVNKLEMIQSRMYDDYRVNSYLRNRFRVSFQITDWRIDIFVVIYLKKNCL